MGECVFLIFLGWHARIRRYRNELKSVPERAFGLGSTFALDQPQHHGKCTLSPDTCAVVFHGIQVRPLYDAMLGVHGRPIPEACLLGTMALTGHEGYRPSQPNTRTKAVREDVDSGALDIGPFGRDGEQALKIVQARGETCALIKRCCIRRSSPSLDPSAHIEISCCRTRSAAFGTCTCCPTTVMTTELTTCRRRSPPLIGQVLPAR
jgi:hypothetical protein